MTNDLEELYTHRADRAHAADDVAQMLAAVRSGALHAQRAKRTRLAVSGGVLVVVATSAVTLAVGPGDGHAHSGPAGNPGTVDQSSGSASSTPDAAKVRREQAILQRQVALEEAVAARSRAQAALRRARLNSEQTTLVSVGPAPAEAETSISLVPKGFEYLSHDPATSYYGLPGTPDQPNNYKEIVVDVHQTLRGATFPITIDGKPGSYSVEGGYTNVRVKYDDNIDVGFQIPPNVTITKSQALEIAATIDVRSTAQAVKG